MIKHPWVQFLAPKGGKKKRRNVRTSDLQQRMTYYPVNYITSTIAVESWHFSKCCLDPLSFVLTYLNPSTPCMYLYLVLPFFWIRDSHTLTYFLISLISFAFASSKVLHWGPFKKWENSILTYKNHNKISCCQSSSWMKNHGKDELHLWDFEIF